MNRFDDGSTPPFLYHGNLVPGRVQHDSRLFWGLTPYPKLEFEVNCDLQKALPFMDQQFWGIQSESVLEHLPLQTVKTALDESYRVVKPGGLIRISLPDYNSPVLRKRSIFDESGRVIGDLMMGADVKFASESEGGGRSVTFQKGGVSHLWFPTYELTNELLLQSECRKARLVSFRHFYRDPSSFHLEPIEHGLMPVARTPPRDMRGGGGPVSLVVDIVV